MGAAPKGVWAKSFGVKIWGAAKAFVVAVTSCISVILDTAPKETQSTAQTVPAMKDGSAEIDVHIAEWLKESDMPRLRVAYSQD
jgi:hypothetical protein